MIWNIPAHVSRIVALGAVVTADYPNRTAHVVLTSGDYFALEFDQFRETPYEGQRVWLEILPTYHYLNFIVWPYNPDDPPKTKEGCWKENGF